LPSPGELAQLPSVALFVARTQAVQSGFNLTFENALAVATICVQLDGLPLAIELAAAQSKHFAPQALAAQLVHKTSPSRAGTTGLNLLRHGWRNLPPRHQTLISAIDWSYRLLTPDEQNLFMQLGVFRGGFTPAAVEAVCTNLQLNAQTEQIAPDESAQKMSFGGQRSAVSGLFSTELTSLLDKSLIQYDEREGGGRFSMLETLREYALAQLAACGKLEATRQRHAEFFIALAEQSEPQLMTAEQKLWFKRLEREQGNFNAILSWTGEMSDRPITESSPHELGLRLSVALWRFWRYRCYLSEGYFWTQRALRVDRNSSHPAPRLLRARALWGLGLISALMRQESEATAQLEESLSLAQAEEEPRWMAAALTGLGMLANNRGDSEQAIIFQEQALALYQSQNDSYGMTYAHNALGETLCCRGNYEAGRKQYEASLSISRQLGHRRGVAVALANMAQVEIAHGNYGVAHDGFVESLQLFQEIGDQVNVATCLMGLGCAATAADSPLDWTQAAQLFGFGYSLLEESGGKLQPADQVQIERHIMICRERLGDAAFEVAWAEGQAFSLEKAVTVATLSQAAKS
jgi:non-specific serine/threonine protein kinase